MIYFGCRGLQNIVTIRFLYVQIQSLLRRNFANMVHPNAVVARRETFETFSHLLFEKS